MQVIHITASALVAASLLLTGCHDSTPKCNSDDAKNLVVSIAQRQMAKEFAQMRNSQMSGMVPKGADNAQLSVLNVLTTSHQSSPDVYQCSADLQITLSGKSTTIPITYNIQNTDDGKNFVINVFGL
ncbi:hypothetical protein DT73_02970 [Mangrovibacter sp. MFB070]|uniref:hypothetical protein n=1 Tax=Mangrovibacter sp. MFB070 TaxID=1224318 RepID=UPI0004D556C6|nr:hypothetical protein [Mangrovibacter sp. MFB070]KEA53012.1 hypothetical protein DT73_09765 [Mangrovibacter sp. MFB070]KEA53974.1 hypothetical protein DT73_02970 [Mangrovibacter sp. MFB070]